MSNDKVKEMKDEDKNNHDLHPYGHEMSDKDPVREQIERDAEKAFNDEDIGSNGSFYAALELADRQDKISWNRCLDEVIRMITVRQDGVYGDSEYSELDRLKQDLEKLRR